MKGKKKDLPTRKRNISWNSYLDALAVDLAHERRFSSVTEFIETLVLEEAERMKGKSQKKHSENSLNSIPRVLPAMPSGEEPLPKRIRKKSAG